MKATELRIGNIVCALTGDKVRLPNYETPFVINSVEVECDCFVLGTNPAQQAKLPRIHVADLAPIPLTEDWLRRMGFEKAHENYMVKKHGGYALAIETGTWYLPYVPHTKVQYVHQLQNLYHALAGVELEIK